MSFFYTDRVFSEEELQVFFHFVFPGLQFFFDNFETGAMPQGFDPENDDHKLCQRVTESDPDEFFFAVNLYRMPGDNTEALNRYVAMRFAGYFQIRTLVTFSSPDMPYDPYYDLIFDNGKIFLADDVNTGFGRDGTARVKYLQEYVLPLPEFDGAGRLK